MECRNCGNKAAYNVRTVYDDGRLEDSCDRCGGVRTTLYDAYCPTGGYFDEHLSHPDKPASYGGTFVPDKATTARLMKEYGLREAGDRVHGANKFDPISHRHASESLKRRKQQ